MPLPVTGGAPQYLDGLNAPSALCTLGKKAMNLTGSILWIMRNHFSTASYIRDPALVDYIWKPQPDDTTVVASGSKILIEPVGKVTGQPSQYLQQRAAILPKRNRLKTVKLGFADWAMPFGAVKLDLSKRNYDSALDTSNHYEVLVVGSHTVFCIGGTEGEAEALGTETFYEMLEFAQLIRVDMNFNLFKVEGMDATAKLEESKEHFVVPITAVYSYFHAWNLTPELPKMKASGVSGTT